MTTEPSEGETPKKKKRVSLLTWFRVALGVIGMGALVLIVRHVGFQKVIDTLRPAIAWLPILIALDVGRIASEAVANYFALGPDADKIPKSTLFRANLIGWALGSFAPAPRVVNETIKVTILGPYVGMPAATSSGFTMQAAVLTATGLFSIPCALAILIMSGTGVWFWAICVHFVVLVGTGVGLRAVTRARGPVAWLAKKLPRIQSGAARFSDHNRNLGLVAWGPTLALVCNRTFQVLQYGYAALAVGIDAKLVGAFAEQGVNLVASAVGVMVPGGFGTTDGAFTLAADMLKTTVARATAIALLMRCTQLVWLLVGSVLLAAIPVKKREAAGERQGQVV